VTIVVVDASRLERNLNLVLQILEITDRVVVCLNLIDEAERHGLTVDDRRLSRDLGVPVVPTSARFGIGMEDLLAAVHEVATEQIKNKPYQIESEPTEIKFAVNELVKQITSIYPDLPNPRWVALRLLDGDQEIISAVQNGEINGLVQAGVEEDKRIEFLEVTN
jgi:ferrous iron transport protein B